MKTCMICGTSEHSERNPLLAESGIYPDLSIHSRCVVTPQYRAWHVQRMRSSVRYRRYWNLMTEGFAIACPQCAKPVRLYPKAVGMGAGHWEVNCLSCYRVAQRGVSGYTHRTVYNQLERLREDYRVGQSASVATSILELARECGERLPEQICRCGGRFSLAAKVRCIHCTSVLMDSYFHYVGEVSAAIEPRSIARGLRYQW